MWIAKPFAAGALVCLVACGGGGGGGPTTYTVGGVVTGLAGSGLVLRNNGRDDLAVSATGAFTFATKLATGAAYSVTVYAQPNSPSQTCVVTNASGVLGGSNVTNVAVACTTNSYTVGGVVTGLGSGLSVVLQDNGGDNLTVNANAPFTFATQVAYGSAYAVTVLTQPTGQYCTVTGGSGTVPANNVTTVAVSCTGGWTWVSGAETINASGVYGTLGTGSTANVPGARSEAISWADSAGNLWLFGGLGYDSTGASGYLNDLWQYTPSNRQWTWVSGAKTQGTPGAYGTLGAGSTANVPGARQDSISWTDNAGNLWLFGGLGYDSTGASGYLNDLWQYAPSTQEWKWVSGAKTINVSGVYGKLGTGSTNNVPGARGGAISWTDSAGNLWLFGGYGFDSIGTNGNLNDLWEYTPSTQQWTWVSGAKTINASGVYGTLGTGSTADVPGARHAAVSWTDSAGNLWLFGGLGNDSTGAGGNLNDLWQYTPSNQQWTWVSGAKTINAFGVYGTLGTGSTTNVPGARNWAISWADSAGNLWLFGGFGYDSTGPGGYFSYLNDLWKYTPSTQQWAWVSGAKTINASGAYGTLGTGSTTNVPGARQSALSWTDSAGNFWLFGGYGYDSTGAIGSLNDLWRY